MLVPVDKLEAAKVVASHRVRKAVTWAAIAEKIDKPLIWTIAALQGQHPMSAENARSVGRMLDLEENVVEALQLPPYRGTFTSEVANDPTIHRLHEVLNVYGPAIKAAIGEEFGDGIMSAINFNLSVERRPDPDGGDRVVVVFDGKFQPYQW